MILSMMMIHGKLRLIHTYLREVGRSPHFNCCYFQGFNTSNTKLSIVVRTSDGSHVPAEGITTSDLKVATAGTNAEALEKGVTTYDPTSTTTGAEVAEQPSGGRAERPRRSAKPTAHSTDFVYF